MTEKKVIKAEQVVTRKGGYVSYYDEGNTLRKAKADTLTVLEAGQEAPKVDTQAQLPPTDALPAPGPAEATSPAQVIEQAGTDTPGSAQSSPTKPKPSKRGNKPKEDADMATKTAAKKKAPAKKAPPAKKTARPARPARPEGEKAVRTIGGKPVDISRYEKSKAPGGGTSYNNGDAVAEKLQGKDLDAVYDIVAKALKVDVADLRKKYKHLNVGMQRMNLGNRLRKVAIPKEAK